MTSRLIWLLGMVTYPFGICALANRFCSESASTLINGKGRYKDGPKVDLAVISVKRNVRYRMRLVSISCDPNWVFSIDKHTMNIIEVDGIAHQPKTVDSIQILAGQRYSFIVRCLKIIQQCEC